MEEKTVSGIVNQSYYLEVFVQQKKLHDTLEINAQMQRELEQKEEKIRILEAKNVTMKQTAEAKTNEVEELKQKLAMLETEVKQFRCVVLLSNSVCV